MTVPIEVAAKLQDMTDLIQELYFPEFDEQTPALHGQTVNKYFAPNREMIHGDGLNVQVAKRRTDSMRPMRNLLSDFANGDRFEPEKFKIRKNDKDPSANDVTRISGSIQTTYLEVQDTDKGKIIDFVEKLVGDASRGYDHTLAILRHSPRSGRLALVNGTPRENDSYHIDGTTSTADNTDGLRCHVDGGSISKFFPGMRIDFYSSAGTLRAGNVRVTDINYADESGGSLGVDFVTGEGDVRDSSGNLANVVDNDEIYLSGVRASGTQEGMWSMEEYFTRPSSGESFIGGVDRTSKDFRWMLTLFTRESETSQTIERSHFDDMCDSMQHQADEMRDGSVITTTPRIHSKLRADIGEDAFFPLPDGDSRRARFANFGNIGLNYQHPILGTVKLISDTLQTSNTVRLLVPDQWTTFFAYFRGLHLVPGGDTGLGGWYRASAETTGTGKGLVLKRDYMSTQVDWCRKPWMNAAIGNTTAA